MSNDFEDIGPMHDPDAELEERFRRLEQEEELDAFKAKVGARPASESRSSTEERFFLVLCPQCNGKNRVSLTRVKSQMPRCGRCKSELWF